MKQRPYLARRLASFRCAASGVCTILATQPHARIHLAAAAGVAGTAWMLGVSALEWCLLLLSIALVWTAEAINTAIEFTIDLVSPDYHPLAGKAKDAAAGAVLLAAILAAIVGSIIFAPRLLDLLL